MNNSDEESLCHKRLQLTLLAGFVLHGLVSRGVPFDYKEVVNAAEATSNEIEKRLIAEQNNGEKK